jgi:PKD repeat protein
MKKLGILFCIIFLLGNGIAKTEEKTKFFKAEAHASCGNVLLTWNQVPNAIGYNIFRCNQEQSTFEKLVQLSAENLFYVDTKYIVAGKQLRYFINAIGNNSDTVVKTPEITAIPGCYDEFECNLALKFQVGNFMYWINGKMDGPMNAAPEQTNGRVFLVIKYITSASGAKLDWFASEKKVTITTLSKKVELWIGKNIAKINGVESKIDSSNDKVAPYLSNGRTMLPMRFVADNLGAQVSWDADTKTATLDLPKDCIEPDCYNLTVESSGNNIVTGVNSAGFRISFDRSAIPSGKVEIGNIVTVCGTFENRDGNIHIKSRACKEIDASKAEWVKGKIISFDYSKNSLVFITCDGKQKSYSYKKESMVENVPKDYPIGLLAKDDGIITWKYIDKEKPCSQEEPLKEDITILELNCDENYIKGEIIGKSKDNQVTYIIGDRNLCSLKPGFCYKISYYYDGLGYPVAINSTEADCPCSFEIILLKPEVKTSSGSKFNAEFRIKNTGKFEGVFEPTYSAPKDLFPEPFEITPKSDTIPPDKDTYFRLSGYIPEDFEGSAEIKVGAKCRNTRMEKAFTLTALAPVFQVGSATGTTDVPTDENVNLTFDVTNYGDGSITVDAMIEKCNFPGKLSIEPVKKEIPEKTTRTFAINGIWDDGVEVGNEYTIRYSASCGSIKKSESVTVRSAKPGPVVVLICGSADLKGLSYIDGSINWKHYTKSKIQVNWGDGTKEDIKGLPASHTYKKKGEFEVSLTAVTKEGINTTQSCSSFWGGPKPLITIEDFTWRQPTATLYGKIDWNNLKPGKLIIDWDDGTVDTKSDFPASHNYKGPGFYEILITARAATGEETSGIFEFDLRPAPLMPRKINPETCLVN